MIASGTLGEVRSLVRSLLPKLHESLLYGGTALLVVDEFLRSTFQISFISSRDVRIVIGIGLLALFAFGINHRLGTISIAIKQLLNRYSGVVEILPPHHVIDFPDIISRCKEVRLLTLSGTQIGMLGDSRVIDTLRDPRRRSRVTILLADPFSDAIRRRYATDEPDNWEAGPDGITRRLTMLYREWQALPPRSRATLEIRVYQCYPTVALIQGDADFYSSSYGFKIRGTDCPKVHATVGGDYATFLLKHFHSVYAEAVPLEQWMSNHFSPSVEQRR